MIFTVSTVIACDTVCKAYSKNTVIVYVTTGLIKCGLGSLGKIYPSPGKSWKLVSEKGYDPRILTSLRVYGPLQELYGLLTSPHDWSNCDNEILKDSAQLTCP